MELNNLGDNVVQVKDYLSLEECVEWLQNVPAPFLMDNEQLSWKYRKKNLKTHPIVNQVERFWNDYFKTTHLKIKDAELQLWPIKSYSVRHNHAHTFTSLNRTSYTYNSMLYLNDNYIGGEFFTDKIEIKPTPGLLTFFDGANTYHGVKPIYWNNRYSIIFWFG